MQTPPVLSDLATQRKAELLNYVQNFYRRSWDWRSQSFHAKWNHYDEMYHSIYDPQTAAKKEVWQTKMFVNMTVQNVEIITSQLHKTMMGPKPPIKTEPGPDGDELQARNIQDVMDYEMRQAMFDVNDYDVTKEAVRYGSGFMKLFWQRVEDTRRRRVPIQQNPQEVLNNAPPTALTGQTPMPQPGLEGFQYQNVPVLLKNCLCAKYIHIRDVFPEPNTTTWDKVIHRDKIPYGTIVAHIRRGEFFDVRNDLEDVTEGDKFEEDLRTIRQERGYFESNRSLSKFEKKHTIWELWAPIPRKWIEFDIPEGDDAETLVPAKVMVASGVALLASEVNEKFDGEVPILKKDYIRTGETYGKGVPELIGDEQGLANETTSQRVDNINLILNKGIAVIENAMVNLEQDGVSKPGWILRIKQAVVDDVRKAFTTIDFPDVTMSAYRETQEIERRVQETTGVGRVTLGTSGEVRDTNQTLGGMQLLQQMFNERVAAYGMVIESSFLNRAAAKIYGLIYQELTPEDLKPILGEEPIKIGEHPDAMTGAPTPIMVPRYLTFTFVPPEIVNKSYMFKPVGIFSLENKIVKSAQVMDLVKINIGNPGFDQNAALKYVAVNLQGITEAEKWFRDVPMIPLAMIPPEMIPMIMGGKGGLPQTNKKDTPGMKGGPNGNGASFAQPSALRRQPVIQ
jgi:hypothetical protein